MTKRTIVVIAYAVDSYGFQQLDDVTDNPEFIFGSDAEQELMAWHHDAVGPGETLKDATDRILKNSEAI